MQSISQEGGELQKYNFLISNIQDKIRIVSRRKQERSLRLKNKSGRLGRSSSVELISGEGAVGSTINLASPFKGKGTTGLRDIVVEVVNSAMVDFFEEYLLFKESIVSEMGLLKSQILTLIEKGKNPKKRKKIEKFKVLDTFGGGSSILGDISNVNTRKKGILGVSNI